MTAKRIEIRCSVRLIKQVRRCYTCAQKKSLIKKVFFIPLSYIREEKSETKTQTSFETRCTTKPTNGRTPKQARLTHEHFTLISFMSRILNNASRVFTKTN